MIRRPSHARDRRSHYSWWLRLLTPFIAITLQSSVTADEVRRHEITVFFGNDRLGGASGDCTAVYPVKREVPASPKVATTALNLLFRGPSADERQAGYYSVFSSQTADLLIDLKVMRGTAYVNLADFRDQLTVASSSCGAAEFQTEISRTLLQYPSVRRIIFAIEGDAQAFYKWTGEPCDRVNDYCSSRGFRSRTKR